MEEAWTILEVYIIIFGALIFGGITVDLKSKGRGRSLLAARKKDLLDCASRYNKNINTLERDFKDEQKQLKSRRLIFDRLTNKSSEDLRQQYETRYKQEKVSYQREAQQIIRHWNAQKKADLPWTLFWKGIFIVGILTQTVACVHSIVSIQSTPDITTALDGSASGPAREWTAQDIPMPHLTDGSRYVSNPDSIVSEETVALLDAKLKQLDDSLGIESVVAIVRRVANADIFRFSQDIFDIYKVGKDDRGLVMVLAYDDHLFRTHTGRSLEADLTDAECFHLQERYLIPSMKAEMPDSGMIYMVEAVYNTLKGKELPVMSELYAKSSSSDDDDDSLLPAIYYFLFFGWIALYFFVSNRHGWSIRRYANGLLKANPFMAAAASSGSGFFVSGGGGGGFRSGGGGGGFSGGFGGGSSGGGGATSSW